jgi:periplasmic divalent cation tolerance protein
MSDPEPVCEVIVTGPTGEGMRELSRAVVAARLAASANVWSRPVLSTYWWRGKLEDAEETRVHFLTREALVPELARFVAERHPYELPNVSAVRLTGGSPAFLQWIRDETAVAHTRGL